MRTSGLLFLLLLSLNESPLGAQSKESPKPDLSLSESKKIAPFPPKEVKFEVRDGHAIIEWTRVPSEKITGYVIYRTVDDEDFQKIGNSKSSPFVDDDPPSGNFRYAVAAVDYNDNQSKPRQAVKKEASNK